MTNFRAVKRFDQLLQAMATQPYLRESLQRQLEHQQRLLPQVMAILELAKVKLQVCFLNPNVSPVDTALYLRPERFDWVGVNIAANIFLCRVIDGLMVVTVLLFEQLAV